MKRLILIISLLFSLAGAQENVVEELRGFSQWLETFCPVADVTADVGFDIGDDVSSAITWVCGVSPTINRAADMAETFLGDVNGFFSQAISSSLSTTLSSVGWDTGDFDLDNLIESAVADATNGGGFSALGVAQEAMGSFNTYLFDNIRAAPPEDASDMEVAFHEALNNEPTRVVRDLQDAANAERIVMRDASAQDIANSARSLTAMSLSRGDEEQIMRRVTSPLPQQQGTADRAEDLGFAAVSSRAAIQALVDAQADHMRQDATSTAMLSTAVKEQAMQQTYTTQQMALLVQAVSESLKADSEKAIKDYYDGISEYATLAYEVEGNYAALATLLSEDPGDAP